MSDCEFEERIGPFYDGELPPEQEREVAEHLDGCNLCITELERLQKLSAMLRTARVPGIPSAALTRMHSAVTAAGRVPRFLMLRMARRVAVAAAVLLVACAIWVWQINGTNVAGKPASDQWEETVLGADIEVLADASQNERMAQWIVQDLSATEEN
jgi:anti-sigma factor RsiW